MADLSDAVRGIADTLNAAFYPAGRTIVMPPGAGASSTPTPSVLNLPVWISRGWPLPESIDLAVGLKSKTKGVWISVFPQVNLTQVTSSVMRRWEDLPLAPATVAVAVDDNAGTVTISGAGSAEVDQSVTILIGASVYSVPVAPEDTPETLVAALVAAIAPDYPTVAGNGAVLQIDDGGTLIAQISRRGTMLGETERERQSIMTTIWAGDDETRHRAAALAREALAAEPRIRLADGSAANLYYRQTNDSDNFEKVGVYRRDIHYWVEYATFIKVDGYEVIAPVVTFAPV